MGSKHGNFFTQSMTLVNNGLISSEVNGQSITLNPAGGFTNNGTLQALNGAILNVGTYTQAAGKTLLVNGSITAQPSNALISIQGGSLEGTGTITADTNVGGALVPGQSAGLLTFASSNLVLTSTAESKFEIGGTNPGTQYDKIAVTRTGVSPNFDGGSLTLAGNLRLTVTDGFQAFIQPTDTFTIMTSVSLSGVFANVAPGQRLLAADGFSSFQVNYGPGSPFDPNNVVLSNAIVPEPGSMTLLGLTVIGMLRRTRRGAWHASARRGCAGRWRSDL